MTDFEKLYADYFNDVFLYILRLSGNEHIAEEITSDTFFKAMHSVDRFRGECDIRVWLCQIAKNSYFSYLKKQKKVQSLQDSELLILPDLSDTAEEQLLRADEAEQIRKILHEINEPYKEVFMWRVFADMSFKQIGQIFSKSENWACVTYHRARKQIRERLEGTENED
ncbi:MAG: sigma-70 family RNA polymerase sigma factor [Clostridia bacterium]|nr:sigma-70 family RNA polymerase sigma factor [Clostridia bacterium]